MNSRRGFLQHVAIGSAAAAACGRAGAGGPAPSAGGANGLPTVTYTAEYHAPSVVKTPELINLVEIEGQAAKVLPAGGFADIAGGAGDEWTLRENRAAFDRRQIVPRVLTGKDTTDTRTTILGCDIALPLVLSPIGVQGLAHVNGEAATTKAAAASGTVMTLSTVSCLPLEQVAAVSTAPKWFQLYLQQDEGENRKLIRRAKAAGYKAIVLTADTTATGNREREARLGFVYPFTFGNLTRPEGSNVHQLNAAFARKLDKKSVEFVRHESGLPVVVKGVSHPDDAALAVAAGASAVWVSNHGGRQLDGGPATFTVLPSVAKAVKGRVPIIFDSGVRRGQDVFKALASGADVVGLGRPVLYGLALGGWKGVEAVLALIHKELTMVMQLAGARTVAEIKRTELL